MRRWRDGHCHVRPARLGAGLRGLRAAVLIRHSREVELVDPPGRALGHQRAQGPQPPVGAGVQEGNVRCRVVTMKCASVPSLLASTRATMRRTVSPAGRPSAEPAPPSTRRCTVLVPAADIRRLTVTRRVIASDGLPAPSGRSRSRCRISASTWPQSCGRIGAAPCSSTRAPARPHHRSARAGQLLLDQPFPDPIPDPHLDRVRPSFPEKHRPVVFRPHAVGCHGVIAAGTAGAGPGWLNKPELTPSNSNHFRDGTRGSTISRLANRHPGDFRTRGRKNEK